MEARATEVRVSEHRTDYAGVRWRVIREVTPAKRYPSSRQRNRRLLVRCTCGVERVVFECDMLAGRTHGCRSDKCRAAWQAVEAIRKKLRTWVRAPELKPMGEVASALDPIRDHVATVMCEAMDKWLLEQGEAHRTATEEPAPGELVHAR